MRTTLFLKHAVILDTETLSRGFVVPPLFLVIIFPTFVVGGSQ